MENLLKEIIAENFPNLGKELDIQVHEANRNPNYLITKRPSPKNIILKLLKVKDKERILRAAREKIITYKGTSIRFSTHCSIETIQDRREWNDKYKILKDRN